MYSTCIFCSGRLGANEAVEHFPVGRRLAFDSAKGRLWVVCSACQRWNLTPIEERWEAVEEAERLFRGQRLRAQTDNIGLTKLREGTELVRIGPALRPEFAAWRYGRVFGARFRRRTAALTGGAVALGAGAAVVGAPIVSAVAALPPLWMIAGHLLIPFIAMHGRFRTTRVRGPDGKVLRFTRADLDHTQLLSDTGDDPWHLRLRHSYGTVELDGERGRRALGAILARVNRGGARSATVREATGILGEAAAPHDVAATG